jgi:hypothetical protein
LELQNFTQKIISYLLTVPKSLTKTAGPVGGKKNSLKRGRPRGRSLFFPPPPGLHGRAAHGVRDQPAPFFANRYIETALFAFLKGTGGENIQIGDNLDVLSIGPATKGCNEV